MEQYNGVNSKKSLEIILSRLKGFETSILGLEQFATPGNLAAELLWTAYMQGHIEKSVVADYGAGTGIIGIGALLLGAEKVIFIESDENAIIVLKENIKSLNIKGNIEIVKGNVEEFSEKSDTVIMNPPFGAVKRNADRAFLVKAFENSGNIYSIHNANSGNFLSKLSKDYNFSFNIISQRNFSIKKTFAHHKKPKEDIKVMLCVFLKIE